LAQADLLHRHFFDARIERIGAGDRQIVDADHQHRIGQGTGTMCFLLRGIDRSAAGVERGRALVGAADSLVQ
jgi:hypothetical protein